MRRYLLPLLAGLLISANTWSQYASITYKSSDSVKLALNIYYPEGQQPEEPLPAILFFFGGGWVQGDPGHFSEQCEYLASHGIIAIAADYRTKNRHGTTPMKSLHDAKSAVRWIRANGDKIGVIPDRLAVAGGSAGGYLAVACAVVDGYDDPGDDLSVSPRPDALVLFNPVINTWRGGYGMKRFGEVAREVSPLHQISPGLPPTLIFHGSDDQVVDIMDIRDFTEKAMKNGDSCKLIEFEGRQHGFFNKRPGQKEDFIKTLCETEKFLINNGFMATGLPGETCHE